MNRTRSDEQGISFLRIDHIQDFLQGTVQASVIKFLCRHVLVETGIYPCTGLCVHHIPYLCLSERIVSFCSNLIVRMDLNRESVIDIKELYQKRELPAVI